MPLLSGPVPPGGAGVGDLGHLPAELRLEVYGHVLRRHKAVLLPHDAAWATTEAAQGEGGEEEEGEEAGRQDAVYDIKWTDGLALLAASRQAHAEAAPVFFECNTVKFLHTGLAEAPRFARLAQLRHVTIHFRTVGPTLRENPDRSLVPPPRGGPSRVRDLFVAIRALAPAAPSLRSITAFETFHMVLEVMALYCGGAWREIDVPRKTWEAHMQLFLEETGVATVEEVLKAAFGRRVAWQDDYLTWTLMPDLTFIPGIAARAGLDWTEETLV